MLDLKNQTLKKNPLHQIEIVLHDLASPRRGHTFWGLLLLLGVAAALIWWKHGAWLQSPGDHMLTDSADGFKNYMTTAWHVRHDSTFVHYDGMNYPFGEHVLFTDNQPLLSTALIWLNNNVASMSERTVGAVNVFQALSLLLGCGILFLLLRKLHLPAWYAGVVALGVVFLSPQIIRLDMHFGLSHTFVFPLLLYLLCRYEERRSRRYQSLQIGMVVWLAAQIHFYYFGLAALFLTLYTGYQVLTDRKWRNIRLRFSHWVVMILLPFALLNLWVHWADFVTDRPSNPYGFTTYRGYWEGVFLPYENFPLFRWLDGALTGLFNMPIRRLNMEAQAYIGLAGFCYTAWVLFSGFRLFGRSWDTAAYHRTHKRYLRGIFTASFVLMIFACGFPFAVQGLEGIVDYFGPLRQFRGLGRFTWAFYYVINTLAFYTLYNWGTRYRGFRSGRAPWLGKALIGLGLVLLVWEAATMQRSRQIHVHPNLEKRAEAVKVCPWLEKVDFSTYQGLLPLPYYHVGSENTWLDFQGNFFHKVQTTALHTGVPDMGVFMSRTSCAQTVKSVQLVGEPCEMPAILNEFPDTRPLAVLVDGRRWDEVRGRHGHLLSKATMIYDGPELKILSLPLDSLRAGVRDNTRKVAEYVNSHDRYPYGVWSSSKPDAKFHYLSYDSLSGSAKRFQGQGAFAGNMGDTTWLWNAPLPKGFQLISLWMHINQDLGMTHEMKIFENRLSDNGEIHFAHEAMYSRLRAVVGNWGLFEVPVQVYEENSRLRIFLHKHRANQPFYMDEVLMRPMTTDLVRRQRGWLVANNYWYRIE